jgi:hypothetical protein
MNENRVRSLDIEMDVDYDAIISQAMVNDVVGELSVSPVNMVL